MVGSLVREFGREHNSCKYHSRCMVTYGKALDCTQCNYLEEIKKDLGEGPVCPRSLDARTRIVGKCNLSSCYFNNTSLSYGCAYLHNTVFHGDAISESVAKSILKIPARDLEAVTRLITYAVRMHVLLARYLDENYDICLKCRGLKNSRCECDDALAAKRLSFEKKWVETINKPRYTEIPIAELNYDKFLAKYGKEIRKIKMIRALLASINIEGNYLTSVPLSVLANAYYSTFGYVDIFNFGLKEEEGKEMIKLYL